MMFRHCRLYIDNPKPSWDLWLKYSYLGKLPSFPRNHSSVFQKPANIYYSTMDQKADISQHGRKRKVEDNVKEGPRKKKVKLSLVAFWVTVEE